MVWAFRAFFGTSSGSASRKAREKRLAIVETTAVDSKRTLYLLRRDDVEHLVVIGGPWTLSWRRESKAVPISARLMTM